MTVVTQAFFKALKTTKSFSGASCFLSRCLIYKVHAASRRSSLSPSDLIILPQAVSLVKNFFQVFSNFFRSSFEAYSLEAFRGCHSVRFCAVPSSACLYYQNRFDLSTPFFDFFHLFSKSPDAPFFRPISPRNIDVLLIF